MQYETLINGLSAREILMFYSNFKLTHLSEAERYKYCDLILDDMGL